MRGFGKSRKRRIDEGQRGRESEGKGGHTSAICILIAVGEENFSTMETDEGHEFLRRDPATAANSHHKRQHDEARGREEAMH